MVGGCCSTSNFGLFACIGVTIGVFYIIHLSEDWFGIFDGEFVGNATV
jgi:hypothetical protein